MKDGNKISGKTQWERSGKGCGLAIRFEGRMQCVGLEHVETDWGRQVQGKTTQGRGENDQMCLPQEQ